MRDSAAVLVHAVCAPNDAAMNALICVVNLSRFRSVIIHRYVHLVISRQAELYLAAYSYPNSIIKSIIDWDLIIKSASIMNPIIGLIMLPCMGKVRTTTHFVCA